MVSVGISATLIKLRGPGDGCCWFEGVRAYVGGTLAGYRGYYHEDDVNDALVRNLAALGFTESSGKKLNRVVRRQNLHGKEASDVIIEASERLFGKSRVYVGSLALRVREYVSAQLCYGCGSFNHVFLRRKAMPSLRGS